MARTFPTIQFQPTSMLPAASNGAAFVAHSNPPRSSLAFDDSTNESAACSAVLPIEYLGTGTLKAKLFFYSASANSGDAGWNVQVESITPGDTLDLEATTSFDTANNGTQALSGVAGNLTDITISLTNKDSCAAGDLIRLGIERDADSSDTVSGDLYLTHVELFEET